MYGKSIPWEPPARGLLYTNLAFETHPHRWRPFFISLLRYLSGFFSSHQRFFSSLLFDLFNNQSLTERKESNHPGPLRFIIDCFHLLDRWLNGDGFERDRRKSSQSQKREKYQTELTFQPGKTLLQVLQPSTANRVYKPCTFQYNMSGRGFFNSGEKPIISRS